MVIESVDKAETHLAPLYSESRPVRPNSTCSLIHAHTIYDMGFARSSLPHERPLQHEPYMPGRGHALNSTHKRSTMMIR